MKVIDTQPVAIALPNSAKAMLPQSTHMANAALPQSGVSMNAKHGTTCMKHGRLLLMTSTMTA
ncbi:hypothetical protein, partial [Prochlorococcus marinus]|uniref:hypothetical protein n=1 Tax=Prochlorococcus marinus TaxID=1219 RepID=UPI001F45D20C